MQSAVPPRMAALFLAVLIAVSTTPARAAGELSGTAAIKMPDGVTLAADVVRPDSHDRIPAILVMTRYGRATRISPAAIKAFTAAGAAIVLVDVRGSGASQGVYPVVFSRDERNDIGVILSWIAAQSWSNGHAVVTGVSYDGNLAALALASDSPVLAATVPRFIDFDTYEDLAIPGGMRNEMLLREWGSLTESLDHGLPCLLAAENCAHMDNLKPLDEDHDRHLLRRSLLEHQKNWHAYQDTLGYAFEDDVTPSGLPLREGFLSTQFSRIAASVVPTQLWGSWFDASTADSALRWFAAAPDAPIEVYLGAWVHGGGMRVDPLLPGAADTEPGAPVPARAFLDFAQRALTAPQTIQRRIIYYTAGAGVWRTTSTWPTPGMHSVQWHFQADGGLGPHVQADGRPGLNADSAATGADHYAVDFTHTTGKSNRWTTQLGGGPVDYGDRRHADAKLLAYTSTPLDKDIEITGSPSLTLHMASSQPDGAVIVYLETVKPDGSVVYLSEGERRLALRGGYNRQDLAPIEPGAPFTITIELHALSVVIPKGYRLRVALAGADADTFARYPAQGAPVYTVFRSAALPSWIDLPQASWH
jgi:putative CocE/NonD family hydrolase